MEVNYEELFNQQQEGVDIGVEPVQNTFTDMVRATLNAILKQDRDAEMQCRSALKTEYRVSDGQITRELFKAFTATEVAVARKTSDSVDLSKVEQLGYLKDGWIPSRDVSLVYGPFGTGKTSLLLALAIAAAKGEPFLDRTTPGERLRTLVIATDSGVGPLKKSLDDLGVDPDDPLFKPGHPDQMIWIWGALQTKVIKAGAPISMVSLSFESLFSRTTSPGR